MNCTYTSEWRYTAEGGANLVLSYIGSDPSLSNKLLRLRKRKLDATPAHPTTNPDLNPDFSTHVVAPLLGEEFAVKMERLRVTKDFLRALRDELKVEGSRPSERAEVDEIDVEEESVMLAENLVNGKGVIAFEIKPKWGFLPSSGHLSPASLPFKTKHCRFCMHSYMKSKKSKKSGTSVGGYCPLDLYSGESGRMSRALRTLWEGWFESNGEGNNFRVFLEGRKLSPNENSDLQLLSLHLNVGASFETLFESVQSLLLPFLHDSPVLAALKHLQSSLDPLDIEGLSATLIQRGTSLSEVARGVQPTLEEWVSWKARWSRITEGELGGVKMDEVDPKDLVLAYLLSASFKDCSILVRFERSESGGKERKGVAKAIDLDPKPIDRLQKYWNLDQEIVETFREALDNGVVVKEPCIV